MLRIVLFLSFLPQVVMAGCWPANEFYIETESDSVPSCLSIFIDMNCGGQFTAQVQNQCESDFIYYESKSDSSTFLPVGTSEFIFRDFSPDDTKRSGVFYLSEDPSEQKPVEFVVKRDFSKTIQIFIGDNLLYFLIGFGVLVSFLLMKLLRKKKIE